MVAIQENFHKNKYVVRHFFAMEYENNLDTFLIYLEHPMKAQILLKVYNSFILYIIGLLGAASAKKVLFEDLTNIHHLPLHQAQKPFQ